MPSIGFGLIAIVFVGIFLFSRWVNILREYERAVTFWLGRLSPHPKGPGLVLIFWPFETHGEGLDADDRPRRTAAGHHHPRQRLGEGQRRRLLPGGRSAAGHRRGGELPLATSQLAQTTLRSVLGQAELDDLLSERDKLNAQLQEIIDKHTEPWGIKVSMVEVKNVDLPQEMQRAMAKQAEAEREKRAKIIHAEGELQASVKLAEAGEIVSKNAVTLQLRYLQTLTEISAEKNSTIIFPFPIDLVKAFTQNLK